MYEGAGRLFILMDPEDIDPADQQYSGQRYIKSAARLKQFRSQRRDYVFLSHNNVAKLFRVGQVKKSSSGPW